MSKVINFGEIPREGRPQSNERPLISTMRGGGSEWETCRDVDVLSRGRLNVAISTLEPISLH
jgi:hypothetical protein